MQFYRIVSPLKQFPLPGFIRLSQHPIFIRCAAQALQALADGGLINVAYPVPLIVVLL
jgi:hypothetical protein